MISSYIRESYFTHMHDRLNIALISTPRIANHVTEWVNSEGVLHREFGPAIIHNDGSEEWYYNNMRHRIEGPAISITNGTTEWWVNNVPHRLNGPAIIYQNGREEWWFHGKRHRLNGPAISEAGTIIKEYYFEGKRHRLDGPAGIWANGSTEWWVDGSRHRMDGPAVVKQPGSFMEWWIDGQIVEMKNHPFIKILIEYNLYDKWKLGCLTQEDWVLLKLSM